MILRNLSDVHHLTLTLICKDMAPIVDFAIEKPRTKKDCSLGHWMVERGRRDILGSFICSKCGKLKMKGSFSDNITVPLAVDPQMRWCIRCNFDHMGGRIYVFPRDGGLKVLCFECKTIMPLSRHIDPAIRSSPSMLCERCLISIRRRYGENRYSVFYATSNDGRIPIIRRRMKDLGLS